MLALAGLERLGLDRMPYRPIDVEVLLPAVGQGALGLETRADDGKARELIAELDDAATHQAVIAERAFLHELGGGCLAPATAFGEVGGGRVELRAAVGDADGVELIRDEEQGPVEDAAEIGIRLARRMKDAGATRLLEKSRDEADRPGPS